jgi:hypothetical protein
VLPLLQLRPRPQGADAATAYTGTYLSSPACPARALGRRDLGGPQLRAGEGTRTLNHLSTRQGLKCLLMLLNRGYVPLVPLALLVVQYGCDKKRQLYRRIAGARPRQAPPPVALTPPVGAPPAHSSLEHFRWCGLRTWARGGDPFRPLCSSATSPTVEQRQGAINGFHDPCSCWSVSR